jgi:hypothetical protein
MKTATKPYYVTIYQMTGFANQNLTRFYLAPDGKWTPNRAKAQAFATIEEAQRERPGGPPTPLIEHA